MARNMCASTSFYPDWHSKRMMKMKRTKNTGATETHSPECFIKRHNLRQKPRISLRLQHIWISCAVLSVRERLSFHILISIAWCLVAALSLSLSVFSFIFEQTADARDRITKWELNGIRSYRRHCISLFWLNKTKNTTYIGHRRKPNYYLCRHFECKTSVVFFLPVICVCVPSKIL